MPTAEGGPTTLPRTFHFLRSSRKYTGSCTSPNRICTTITLPQGGRTEIGAFELRYVYDPQGDDTVEANEQLGFLPDDREYDVCKAMLAHFNVGRVRLMTNNPRKVAALESLGIEVTERLPIQTGLNPHNENYLAVKGSKLGHLFKKEP